MIRIALFLLTNIGVMLILSLITKLTGYSNSSTNGFIILSGLLGFGGAFISLLLSKWTALRAVGGKIIEKANNETESWLINTIYQQSKKVGISMPQIAIYDSVDINAFATGARKNSSLIAVSTGLLKNMKYDEAEAVLAHEISHISNGDMVTMTLVQGVVNTFVIFISRFIAQLVSGIFNQNDQDSNDSNYYKNNHLVYLIISTILEIIFGILASIITMWFSRHREFYADAGSAKLVGKLKMISALQKLKTSYEPQEPSNIIAFCINGKQKTGILLSKLFMSHPPLDERIEALFQNKYLK